MHSCRYVPKEIELEVKLLTSMVTLLHCVFFSKCQDPNILHYAHMNICMYTVAPISTYCAHLPSVLNIYIQGHSQKQTCHPSLTDSILLFIPLY